MPYANNKGIDQISAFVVHCLDSLIPLVSISKTNLQLVSVAAQASLSLSWSDTPKTGFLVTRPIYHWGNKAYPWLPAPPCKH